MLNTNQEQIERATNLLTQAQAVLATVTFDVALRSSPADLFIPTLVANVDNEKLSDAEFRLFVRNSLPTVSLPPERQVVMTNRGEAYRVGGLWFKWHGTIGSKIAIKDQDSITDWHYVEGLPKA
jgi:hypothetical protein